MKMLYPRFLLLLICSSGCISCTRNIYIPSQVNAPLLHEKNQIKIDVTPSNLHGAYAITDKFAVMVSGQYTWERFGRASTGRMGYFTRPLGGVAEAGVGVFKKFSAQNRPPLVLDLYVGNGAGGFRMVEQIYYSDSAKGSRHDYTIRTRFRKFFIQPGVGMVHKRVELSFTPRFTFLRYAKPHIGNRVSQEYETNYGHSPMTYLPEMKKAASGTVFLYEPAFTLRVGTPRFKWHFQLQGSIPGALDPSDYYPSILITSGISAGF